MKTSRPQKRELHVAFVVPVFGCGPNRILAGVSRYAMVNTAWRLHLVCGNYRDIFPALKKAGVDGVFISFIFDQPKRIISDLLAAKLPCIGFQCSTIPRGIPYFTSESFKAGRVIAEYFIDRGFRNFAYYSLTNVFWSQHRMKGFCDRLEKAGYSASIYRAAKTGVPKQDWQIGRAWLEGLKGPVNWLRSLPKPVGLMVCYDGIGYDLIQTAEKAGIRVPEDVAVVSVDNNEILCNATKPPLSSVEFNVEQAGYEAAELLNAIMTGKEVISSRPILTRVVRVVTRQSSDILAINDPEVVAALYFIRTRFNSPIQVSDVIRATSISRRYLEKKFRSILKRSILDEIMRVRIEYISNHILKSGMSIDQIAAASPFDSTSHMIRVFKKYKGMPPQTFRKMHGVILRRI